MKLRVPLIVAEAYGSPLTNGRQLIAAMPRALIIMLVLWGLVPVWQMVPTQPYYLVAAIKRAIDALPYAVFGLIWFHCLLLPRTSPLRRKPLLNRRSLAYFGWAILFFLAVCLTFVFVLRGIAYVLEVGRTGALGVLPVLILACIMLPGVIVAAIYVSARLSLLVPAAASDAPLSPATAWRAIRGNGWRLVGAYLLAGLPPGFAALGFEIATIRAARGISKDFDTMYIFIASMISAPLRLVMIALLASVAAWVFRNFTTRGLLRDKTPERPK